MGHFGRRKCDIISAANTGRASSKFNGLESKHAQRQLVGRNYGSAPFTAECKSAQAPICTATELGVADFGVVATICMSDERGLRCKLFCMWLEQRRLRIPVIF